MTPFKLHDLQNRLKRLQKLIAAENRGTDEASRRRLAAFVILNPHSLDYVSKLDELLADIPEEDPLRDNVLLGKILWVEDAKQRQQMLTELITQYGQTDAGIRARYELALVKVQLWKDPLISEEVRTQLLAETRTLLTDFLSQFPDSIFAAQAQDLLNTLPHRS
jgi:ribosomal 50S subunit-associated protein YjgA (DUF615 family)